MNNGVIGQLSATALSPTVVAWGNTILKNGGVLPSTRTFEAANKFYQDLGNNGLLPKMLSVNIFAPDNLTAFLTPLIATAGSSSWVNHGFLGADLSVNGMQGNNVKYLDTGLSPSATFTTASAGMTVYNTTGKNENADDIGSWAAGTTTPNMVGYVGYGDNNSYWDCWQASGNGRISTSNISYAGAMMFNRPSTTASSIYKFNSTAGFQTLVSNTSETNIGTVIPTPTIYVFGANNGSGGVQAACSRKLSFAAIHLGMSITDATLFLNIIQTMRKNIGGGWV